MSAHFTGVTLPLATMAKRTIFKRVLLMLASGRTVEVYF